MVKPYLIDETGTIKVIRVPALHMSFPLPLVDDDSLREIIENMMKCEKDCTEQIINDIIELITDIRQSCFLSANYIRR